MAAPGLTCGMRALSCGMWDLVSWPGIKPGPPALGAWSLNPWTTREVLTILQFKKLFLKSQRLDWGKYLPWTRKLYSYYFFSFFFWESGYLINFTFFFNIFLFPPVLLRYNWHTALYKFKVYSTMIWLTNIMKWTTIGLVNLHHLTDTKEKKKKKIFFPCDENS